jgi:hypothetical protein
MVEHLDHCASRLGQRPAAQCISKDEWVAGAHTDGHVRGDADGPPPQLRHPLRRARLKPAGLFHRGGL